MEANESEQIRVIRIHLLSMCLLGLIFGATLITLPFSNRSALWIYLFGGVVSAFTTIFEARNRAVIYQVQGKAGTAKIIWSRTQGGLLGKMTQAIGAVFVIALWPSRLLVRAVSLIYSRRVNYTAFLIHGALLVPRYLFHIPIVLALSWMTYNEIHANGYTLEAIVFVAMTTLCAALYMLMIGAASFRAYVSENLTPPAVNAVLIALQLGLTVVFVVANLLPLARPGPHAVSAAVVQLFNLSELSKALKQTALALVAGGAQAPGENLAYGLIVLVIIAGFYASVFKAVLSGIVFGRSDSGRLVAAAYFRTRGDFRKASNFLKGVDNKNPIKQNLLLQVQLARGEIEGSFASAARLLRLVGAEDSPENQSALIVTAVGAAVAGMDEVRSRKDFSLAMISALRLRKVHDLFALCAVRELFVTDKLSDGDIADLKRELLAEQPDNFLWEHLELVTVPYKHPSQLTEGLLLSARAAARRDADFLSRAGLFWPIFTIWATLGLSDARAADEDRTSVPMALQATLDEVLAHRFDRKLWEALLLLNFIAVPIKLLAAGDADGTFVSEEHLAAVDEWVAQLANEGIPGMSEIDLTSMSQAMTT